MAPVRSAIVSGETPRKSATVSRTRRRLAGWLTGFPAGAPGRSGIASSSALTSETVRTPSPSTSKGEGGAGSGAPQTVQTEATDAPVEILLDRAVQDVKSTFASKIQKYFEDTYTKGRNARILLKRWEDAFVDFESEVTYGDQEAELGEVIQVWMNDNCVGGQFNLINATDNTLDFNPARIPVRGKNLAGKEVPIDAAGFVRNLSKWLKSQYGIESRVLPKGLGEAWLVIGGK